MCSTPLRMVLFSSIVILLGTKFFNNRRAGSLFSIYKHTRSAASLYHLSSMGESKSATGTSQSAIADFATVSYVTAPSAEVARHLAEKLISKKLAACVNVVNQVESIYEWEGKLERSFEAMMIIKSHSRKSIELADFVMKNHPYECAEVITMKVESGNQKYLDWINASVNKDS